MATAIATSHSPAHASQLALAINDACRLGNAQMLQASLPSSMQAFAQCYIASETTWLSSSSSSSPPSSQSSSEQGSELHMALCRICRGGTVQDGVPSAGLGVLNVAWKQIMVPLFASFSTTTNSSDDILSDHHTRNIMLKLLQFVVDTVTTYVLAHSWENEKEVQLTKFYASYLVAVIKAQPQLPFVKRDVSLLVGAGNEKAGAASGGSGPTSEPSSCIAHQLFHFYSVIAATVGSTASEPSGRALRDVIMVRLEHLLVIMGAAPRVSLTLKCRLVADYAVHGSLSTSADHTTTPTTATGENEEEENDLFTAATSSAPTGHRSNRPELFRSALAHILVSFFKDTPMMLTKPLSSPVSGRFQQGCNEEACDDGPEELMMRLYAPSSSGSAHGTGGDDSNRRSVARVLFMLASLLPATVNSLESPIVDAVHIDGETCKWFQSAVKRFSEFPSSSAALQLFSFHELKLSITTVGGGGSSTMTFADRWVLTTSRWLKQLALFPAAASVSVDARRSSPQSSWHQRLTIALLMCASQHVVAAERIQALYTFTFLHNGISTTTVAASDTQHPERQSGLLLLATVVAKVFAISASHILQQTEQSFVNSTDTSSWSSSSSHLINMSTVCRVIIQLVTARSPTYQTLFRRLLLTSLNAAAAVSTLPSGQEQQSKMRSPLMHQWIVDSLLAANRNISGAPATNHSNIGVEEDRDAPKGLGKLSSAALLTIVQLTGKTCGASDATAQAIQQSCLQAAATAAAVGPEEVARTTKAATPFSLFVGRSVRLPDSVTGVAALLAIVKQVAKLRPQDKECPFEAHRARCAALRTAATAPPPPPAGNTAGTTLLDPAAATQLRSAVRLIVAALFSQPPPPTPMPSLSSSLLAAVARTVEALDGLKFFAQRTQAVSMADLSLDDSVVGDLVAILQPQRGGGGGRDAAAGTSPSDTLLLPLITFMSGARASSTRATTSESFHQGTGDDAGLLMLGHSSKQPHPKSSTRDTTTWWADLSRLAATASAPVPSEAINRLNATATSVKRPRSPSNIEEREDEGSRSYGIDHCRARARKAMMACESALTEVLRDADATVSNEWISQVRGGIDFLTELRAKIESSTPQQPPPQQLLPPPPPRSGALFMVQGQSTAKMVKKGGQSSMLFPPPASATTSTTAAVEVHTID